MQFRSKLLLLTSTVLLSAFLFSQELLIGDANFQPEESTWKNQKTSQVEKSRWCSTSRRVSAYLSELSRPKPPRRWAEHVQSSPHILLRRRAACTACQ
eukprot:symbB.v1.2.039442.t1/scaffold6568.1/size17006/2